MYISDRLTCYLLDLSCSSAIPIASVFLCVALDQSCSSIDQQAKCRCHVEQTKKKNFVGKLAITKH